MPRHRPLSRLSALVFCVAIAYSLGVQLWMRPQAINGLYFHRWSSEDMMQTVSLRYLREDPIQTLLNIHIQPPGFDGIRALLAVPWRGLSDEDALRHVDSSLYLLGSILLGLLVAVTYAWLAEYSVPVALAGSMLLLLHPASIFFATFLDSTLLSTLLVTCAVYYLWRMKNGRSSSVAAFAALALALFFTRSVFQWPAFFLLAISLYLMGTQPRRIWGFLAATLLIGGTYLVKQQLMFGLFSTTSFTGISLSNSIGAGVSTEVHTAFIDDAAHQTLVRASLPGVLTSKTKINGQRNFNNIDYLIMNTQLLDRFKQAFRHTSPAQLAGSYLQNALIYFMPTSTYDHGHVIVDNLPWTSAYNVVFSAPVLPTLLLMALAIWVARLVKHKTLGSGIGLLLPALYILAASIFLDKGENMRFKFWLEPLMLIFIISQLVALRELLALQARPTAAAH